MEISFCVVHHRETTRAKPTRETRVCAWPTCEKEFEWSSSTPGKRFCSKACAASANNNVAVARGVTGGYDVSVTEKRCTGRCGELLPAAAFSRDRRYPDGLAVRCKVDTKVYVEKIKADNPRAAQKGQVRGRLRGYNLVEAAERLVGYEGDSVEGAYDAIYDAQGGLCAWCLKPGGRQTEPFRQPGKQKAIVADRVLAIDHNHDCCPTGGSCGKCVRCLMHVDCNLQHKLNLPDLNDRVHRMRRVETWYRTGILEVAANCCIWCSCEGPDGANHWQAGDSAC